MAGNNKPKALTKTAVLQELATSSNLTKKQVGEVLDALTALLRKELGKKGPGLFGLAGLIKIKRVHKPATKERMGRNPATGEPMVIKAKPARTVVKALALKSLKEMVK